MHTRREMIGTTTAALGGVALGSIFASSALAFPLFALPTPGRVRAGKLGKLQILQVGVGGSIAPADREELKKHTDVVFSGLCDVDSDALASVALENPQAFTCIDFRDAFTKHGDKFDAVVVCTPDHNHALVDMTALKAGKHVYGQKPLVQQLSEVSAIEAAIQAHPELVTQTGNQRMGPSGRQYAAEILRAGLLGKAIEAHVWIGGPPDDGSGYFYYGGLKAPSPVPSNIDWPLWLGAAMDAPYREGLVGLRWRSSFDYGTGQLGDWCTHLLDILYFAYDLPSPISVLADTHFASDFYHALHVRSTLAYSVKGDKFKNSTFPVIYADKGQAPSRAALGLPPGKFPDSGTLVVCEGGVLFAEPSGDPKVWIDGKAVDFKTLPGLATMYDRNHWHSWVDRILGKSDAFVQTPFNVAAHIAEAGLLAAKAARFPGQELLWDKASLTFTNNEEATKSIVRREYREGFALPTF